ncbi:MAG TPA: 3-dehydroquinate synthase [Chitinispirillaceae bacterium]|nr:3-dehydroquinate synthase [Chitinispirillaceae bacterium]
MNLSVNLGENSYNIELENQAVHLFPGRVKRAFQGCRFALVTNTTLSRLYEDLLNKWKEELDLVIFSIPDGEAYKTLQTWSSILDFLLQSKLERSSVIIAFGGGVVGDITGFAAATFLRGVRYIQVPTTLLAMVDSSVGGKTAVDHPAGKNLVGAFHHPRLVFADTSFLNTLSEREFLSGYAELFKYGFIGGRDMFSFITANHDAILRRDSEPLQEGIRRSISIKAQVVELDQFETTGNRALLNLGHTFAHSLEKYFNFSEILHGEAVYWGIRCAVETSKRIGLIAASDFQAYDALISRMKMPNLPSKPEPQRLYENMFSDKKVASGKIKFVLPTIPGISEIRSDVSQELIFSVINTMFY